MAKIWDDTVPDASTRNEYRKYEAPLANAHLPFRFAFSRHSLIAHFKGWAILGADEVKKNLSRRSFIRIVGGSAFVFPSLQAFECAVAAPALKAEGVLVEAESFADHGEWKLAYAIRLN